MDIVLELQYVKLLTNRLDRFTQKHGRLFNCRCPICGDSDKKASKARGYFFEADKKMFYKCHNCGASMTFRYFLKRYFPDLYDDMMLESIKRNRKPDTPKKQDKPKPIVQRKIDIDLPSADSLSSSHVLVKYLRRRKIPKEHWSDLFFAKNFCGWIESVEGAKYNYPDEPRLVIPFRDFGNQVHVVQARDLYGKSKLRYLTHKFNKNFPKIYGLDRVNTEKSVYVVEGALDSLFLPNCIAVAGYSAPVDKYIPRDKLVFIYDNEPKNKYTVESIQEAISKGYRVSLWPKTILHKDINDMVIAGLSRDDIVKIIDCHTYSGLEATLALTHWKRI